MKYDLLGRPVLTPAQKRAEQEAEAAAYAQGAAEYEQVQALLKQGHLAEAQRVARTVTGVDHRNTAIKAVALAQVQAGDLPAAIATSRPISYTNSREEVVEAVIKVLLTQGEVVAALLLAATVVGFGYVSIHELIATTQQQLGHAEAARRTLLLARDYAHSIDLENAIDGYYQSFYLGHVAKAQVRLGDVTGAIQTAHLINEPNTRQATLEAIGQV